MQITLIESARSFIDRELSYHPRQWSVPAERGDPVPKSQTSNVYFTVKANEGDSATVLDLSVTEGSVVWLDANDAETADGTATKVRVKLGLNTEGKAGTHRYELRVKLSDGSFLTAEKGILVIEESITDTP